MNMFTHFSFHSLKRIEQRTLLSFDDLRNILDTKSFINIGVEPGFNREHRLFYSVEDQEFFVVIQDNHTGGVVTVLPIDYHNNISWKVKESDKELARQLSKNPNEEHLNFNITEINMSSFIISALFNDDEGKQKTKVLYKVKPTIPDQDLNYVINTRKFELEIKQALVDKNLTHFDVWSISVRQGKNGKLIFFDWENDRLI